MKWFLYLFTATVLVGLAIWAYQENYKTQQALNETQRLQREIGAARERLALLRADWAYLNRPDRLRDLAEMNFDRLALLPLRPEHFGRIDQVAFPDPTDDVAFEITDAIDVSSQGERP